MLVDFDEILSIGGKKQEQTAYKLQQLQGRKHILLLVKEA